MKSVPDMPCEMLTPGEYHATLPIAPTLEGLCWGRTVPFSVVAGRLGPSKAWHIARVRWVSYSSSGHIGVCNEFRGRILKIRGRRRQVHVQNRKAKTRC